MVEPILDSRDVLDGVVRYSTNIIVLMPKICFHVVLFKPEIPYNTGNIIRLCANIGAELHLIRPLGFEMTESRLRRAALDYRDLAIVTEYDALNQYIEMFPERRFFATSSRAKTSYAEVEYREDDAFLFGPESVGLPDDLLSCFPENRILLVPMMPGSRSLNIANSVSVIAYEAWRQLNFQGRAEPQ